MPRPGFRPIISVARLVGLTFAVIAPCASVFLTYGAAYQSAGTGLVLGFVIGAVLNLLVMSGYAEVGSVYPECGGDYSLASRALGPRVGSIYTSLFTFKGMVIPAVLSLATASYLNALVPSLPLTPLAVLVLLLYLALAYGHLGASSYVASVMVVLEGLVMVAFLIVALTSLHQPWSVLVHPVMASGHVLVAATSGGILAATVASVFAYNGAEAALYYSEETRARPENFGRVIMGTAATTVLLELIVIIAATLALPSLHLATNTSIPLAVIIQKSGLGQGGTRALLLGVTIAMFDTGLAATLGYGRIYFAIARDGQWPNGLNAFFLRQNRYGVPYGPYLVLGVINLVITVFSTLTNLVVFTGALLMLLYLGVTVAALVVRRRVQPPYRMPLWPLLPVLALAGLLFVLTQLSLTGILVTVGMVVLGVAWSFGRRKAVSPSA